MFLPTVRATTAAHRRATTVPAYGPPAFASAKAKESKTQQALLCGCRYHGRVVRNS
jgi:hypothetical protein